MKGINSAACTAAAVGTLVTENFRLSVLTGTDSQENTAFDLRLWRRLPKLNDRIRIMGV